MDFLYKAKKGPGEVLEGKISADSERSAVNQLINAGYYPVWVKEEMPFPKEKLDSVSFFSKRVKASELADFTRQLSELLDSGLALYEALNIVENQLQKPQLREVVRGIKDSIKDGNSFSGSLKAYPDIFSNLYINLAKSGESAGMLASVLSNMANFLEKEEDARSRVMASLLYPGLMAGVGVITVFILMVFVIPKLAAMFTEMGEILPLPTRMLIGFSGFVKTYWALLALFAAVCIIAIKRVGSDSAGRKAIDRFRLKMPILGMLVKDTEFARFSRTLSTLLKNGVPILNALKITSDIIENAVIKEEINLVYGDIKSGSSLAAALKKRSFFPAIMVNMALIGEESGSLDKVLLKVAETYERDADRRIKTMSTLIEPVMILAMGLIVGFIVISMLLPVFQISLAAH